MGNLPISSGWVFLLGGVSGIVTCSISKTFSWSNYEFVRTEEDRKAETPMTPLKRSIIIGVCVLIALYGAYRIQHDQNWNPFDSGSLLKCNSVEGEANV
jgi:hypothetical protein